MANFDTIKTAIDANIKTNGTQDITGGKMNSILKQMVDATDEQLTELESEIVGDFIQQPSELTPEQRYIQANGNYVTGSNLYSILIPVAHLRGKHLTQNGSTGNQYAFVKYATDANVVFADGCSRESGLLNNTLVPSDASYLYVYLGDLQTNQTQATFIVVDGKVGIQTDVANIQTDVANIQTNVADNSASIQSIEGNFTSVIQSVNINEDSSWKKLQGYVTNVESDGNYIIFTYLEGYDSYYRYVEKDSQFSANAESNGYYSICYGENAGEFPSLSSSFKVATTGSARLRKSESNLPSDSNPLLIPKGSIIVVSVKTTDANTFIQEKKENNAIKDMLISIEATNEYSYLINLGKYQVDLMKVVSTSANSELWNMLNLRSNGIQITMGDILGVIKEQGEDDFMGGVHGDEKIVYLNIHCDGIEWDRQSKVLSNNITIDMFSNIFRVSTKEHIYNKVVHIEFKRNNIRITNTYKCLVNGSVIESAVNGGLIDCRQEILTSVVMPNYYSPIAPTTQPNNASKVNTEGTFYWINGAINVRNLQGKELDTFMGYDWLYVVNGEFQRNKIYMDLVKKNPVTLNNGDELCGICEYNLL